MCRHTGMPMRCVCKLGSVFAFSAEKQKEPLHPESFFYIYVCVPFPKKQLFHVSLELKKNSHFVWYFLNFAVYQNVLFSHTHRKKSYLMFSLTNSALNAPRVPIFIRHKCIPIKRQNGHSSRSDLQALHAMTDFDRLINCWNLRDSFMFSLITRTWQAILAPFFFFLFGWVSIWIWCFCLIYFLNRLGKQLKQTLKQK